jgi:hypothetical protein
LRPRIVKVVSLLFINGFEELSGLGLLFAKQTYKEYCFPSPFDIIGAFVLRTVCAAWTSLDETTGKGGLDIGYKAGRWRKGAGPVRVLPP